MSSLPDKSATIADERLRDRLRVYYTRYYRDTLGIPKWNDLVKVRLEELYEYERTRLTHLERALGRPVSGLRLLNVGCGTGGFSQAAEEAGALGWGIDPEPQAVAIASGRVSRVGIALAEAEALPFRAGSFDVVYCMSALEHTKDWERALREMVRVLRPKGWLYLHTPSRWSCYETHYKLLWIPGSPRWLGKAYLAVRGRPTAYLDTLSLTTLTECTRVLVSAGVRTIRALDHDATRRVGGPLWPLVRLYYALFRVHPYVELVAIR